MAINNNKSRSERLLESMRIIAPGVTHRGPAAGSSAGGSLSSIAVSLEAILRKLHLLPAAPPPLRVNEETSEALLIPVVPPGPRGPAGPAGPTGATGAAGASSRGGAGGPQNINFTDDTSLLALQPRHGERGVTRISGTNAQITVSQKDGPVTISLPQAIRMLGASDSLIILDTTTVQNRYLRADTNSVVRWLMYLANNTAEGGSNAGSNFALGAYTDGGAFIDTPISIARVAGGHISLARPTDITGDVSITGNLAVSGTLPATAGGAFTLISEHVLTGDDPSVAFTSIPGTYRHLKIICWGRSIEAVSASTVNMRFNTDSSASYSWELMSAQGNGTSLATTANTGQGQMGVGVLPGTSSTRTTQTGTIEITIPMYANATWDKTFHSISGISFSNASTSNNPISQTRAGAWTGTSAITRIDLFPNATGFKTGNVFSLYGMS